MELSDGEAEWSEEEEMTEEIYSESENESSEGDQDENDQASSKEDEEEEEEEGEIESSEEGGSYEVTNDVDIDHTDYILDSIDKELNALINKNYPVVQSNGHTPTTRTLQNGTSQPSRRKDGQQSRDSTIDTGLGTSSPPIEEVVDKDMSRKIAKEFAKKLLEEEDSPKPGNEEFIDKPKSNKVKGTNGKVVKSKRGSKKTDKTPKPNNFHSSLDQFSTSTKISQQRVTKRKSKNNNSEDNESSIETNLTGANYKHFSGDSDHYEEDSSSAQGMEELNDVSSNDGDEESVNYSQKNEISTSADDQSTITDNETSSDDQESDKEEKVIIRDHNSLIESRIHKTSDFNYPDRKYSQLKVRLGRVNDVDSMATDDIIHELDTSFGPPDYPPLPPTVRSSYVYKETSTDCSIKSAKPTKRARKKGAVNHNRSKRIDSGVGSDAASGLPEYMYIRKPVGESDVGTDSIHTEHYEPLFCASCVYTGEGFKPNLLTRKLKVANGNIPSDVESVQTEDFERHFRNMMVKQVAGVPIMSFDTVTIPSDLDSVKSDDVRETFQTILKKKKGFRNKSVERLSNQSDATSDINSDFESLYSDPRDLRKTESDKDYWKGRLDTYIIASDGRIADRDGVKQVPCTPQSQTYTTDEPRSTLNPGSKANKHFIYNGQKQKITEGRKHALDKKRSVRNRSSSDSFVKSGEVSKLQGNVAIKAWPHVSNKANDNNSRKSTLNRQAKPVPASSFPKDDYMFVEEEQLRYQVSSLKDDLNDIKIKKKIALGELKMLLDTVYQNKNDIKKADDIVRQHMEKADAARSELMVLEFQRDQAQRELRDVEEETAAKGRTLQELDRRSSHNSRDDLLGLSKAEIISLVKERDNLKEQLYKKEGGTSELQRTELERQLNLAKQGLFAEQKTSREKTEKMKEELEEQHHKIDELQYNHDKKIQEYEEKVNDLEEKAMQQLAEKNTIIENIEKNHKKETMQMEAAYAEREEELNRLNKTIQDKQEIYNALKDKLYRLQEELSKSQATAKQILEEKEEIEKNIEIDKQTALLEMRDNLLKEKQNELGKLKHEMEMTQQDVIRKQEETFNKQTNKYDEDLKEKESEINLLKSRLQEQEQATRVLGEKLRKEAHDQIKSAIKQEREIWEEESKKSVQREMAKKKEEERWATTQLKADIAKEKQFSSQLQIAINSLKEELDSLRQENLKMHRQKVEAVSKIREEARQERQSDVEEMRLQLSQEKAKELQKIKESEKEKDEEIKRLKAEIEQNREREREVLSDHERNNRSIVTELNDECRKTNSVLGVSSKKSSVGNGKRSSSGSDIEMPNRVQVLSALGNMKGCNEDLRNKLQELKHGLEKQKRINMKASKVREKEKKNRSLESPSSLQAMKERLELETSEELETLQEQIIKLQASESALQGRLVDKDREMRQVQKSMGLWKEETALKMAKKFEEELNKELDLRMQDSIGQQSPLRKSANSDRSASPVQQDASTVKLLRHLQEKMKLLRQENASLKRGLLNSSHMSVDGMNMASKLEDNEQKFHDQRQKEFLMKQRAAPKRAHSYGKLP